LTLIIGTTVHCLGFAFGSVFFSTGQEEELRAVVKLSLLWGRHQVYVLKDPWQFSRHPSGRHMLGASTGLRRENDNMVGNENLERESGMNFELSRSKTAV
jgi:hypothetical protein